MTILLRSSSGGYDAKLGFDATQELPVAEIIPGTPESLTVEDGYDDDPRSRQPKPVFLADHLNHVARRVRELCAALGETEHSHTLTRAGQWHDMGKTHPVFNATMHTCSNAPPGFLAKSPCNGRHSRRFFRHELASALAWLAQHDGEPGADLIAYLIAAHHGKVRMSLRAMPTEEAKAGVNRFARGVWEGDTLPANELAQERGREITLTLALMETGEGDQGPSWAARALCLLETHGPFQLSWLESILRTADWRASAEEQLPREPDGK